MIGILPNQIRNLFSNKNEGNRAFEEISKELFWRGFEVWSKRKRMMSNFWKKIAPSEWQLHHRKMNNKDSNN